IQISDVIDKRPADEASDKRASDPGNGRVSHGEDHVRTNCECAWNRQHEVRQVIRDAAAHPVPRVGGRADALDDHSVARVAAKECKRIKLVGIVRGTPGDDGDFVMPGESLSHLSGHLRRGGSVGRVVFVQKQNVHALQFSRLATRSADSSRSADDGFLSKTKSPRTRTSIRVRRKHSRASCGRQTIGSLSLNEVFKTIGTPVRWPTARKSFQKIGFAERLTVCKRAVPSTCVGAGIAARFSGRTEYAKVMKGEGCVFSKNSPVASSIMD